MSWLFRILAVFAVATRRLLSQRGLALATAIGLVATVAIVMSIPLYTDAVYYQILQKELTRQESEEGIQRSPFAFKFRYVGSLYGLKQWEDIEQVDAYLTEQAPRLFGLPHRFTVRYFRTDNFRLFPTEDVAYANLRDPLAWVNFAAADDFAEHIRLVEGALPAVASSDPEEPMEIVVSRVMAEELGIQAGEEYVTFRRSFEEGALQVVQIPIRVTGIWEPTDPADEYWFYRQTVFDNQFFIPEESFRLRIVPLLKDEVAEALWYLVMDGSNVNSGDVGRLLGRINNVQQQSASLLTNTRLEVSPQDALQRYRQASQLLNFLLYAFSIPIIGLLLAFIGLVVGLAVSRQRNEIAVLRSRGATVFQVMGIAGLEAALLGAFAFAAGVPASQRIAETIGSTRSFLNFTVDSDLRVIVTMASLRFGLAAVAVTMFAQLFPSFGAARHTIVSYKRDQARTARAPWWQRAWLDVLLLIPAGYGAYLLRQQGSITLPGAESQTGDSFENPLLFLVPALAALALTLLVLRLLPWLMAAVARIAAKTNSIGFLLATRYLARDPAFYTAPLVLLILTLSMSTFTASLAQTLENHLFDKIYYSVGSDVQLVELGRTEPIDGEERWVFVPVGEHLKVPDIKAATRVGTYGAGVQLQGKWTDARFLGVDRVEFPKAAYWRRDFAPANLGALMNALAVTTEGVLLPGDFMRENAIRDGDPISVRVTSYGQQANLEMKVIGEFEHFPTWYPKDEDEVPLIVGNLDYLFEQAGGELPYDVWTKMDEGFDDEKMVDELRKLDISVLDYSSSPRKVADEQRLPQRQGLFGVLSVGFMAAALLTVLGSFLCALFSFRRRFIELGTLRAIGLSAMQMTTFLAWELAFVILLGLGTGTLIGVVISDVFIPYLQVGADAKSVTPPFQVEIAWPAISRIYVLFGLLFVVALSVLAWLLLRMKIFQAIKLGETV